MFCGIFRYFMAACHPEQGRKPASNFCEVQQSKRAKAQGVSRSGISNGVSIAFVCGVASLMTAQKSNTEQKSYCISLGDPFVAIAPRFCSAHCATQNFDYGLRPTLRMTRSRKMAYKLVGRGLAPAVPLNTCHLQTSILPFSKNYATIYINVKGR